MAKLGELVENIKDKFPNAVEETISFQDEYTIRVKREKDRKSVV